MAFFAVEKAMRVSFFWLKGRGVIGVGGLMVFLGWFAWQIASAQQGVSLGVSEGRGAGMVGTTRAGAASLPAVVRQELDASLRGPAVNAGGGSVSGGQVLVSPVVKGAVTLAILGDLAPTNEASAGYIEQATRELNLLRPDAVLTVGNLVDGFTRSEEKYAVEAVGVHRALDEFVMPWYPCAGDRDVFGAGVGALYEKYMGPRYYSFDAGDVHVIVLDSLDGEKGGAGIGAKQREWLKADLARTFDLRRVGRVIVLMHRPLWLEEGAGAESWERVHGMLVEFNRKPIVAVEGPGGGGGIAGMRGAKVVGVFAGKTRAYTQDAGRDGIGYWRLGATAAVIEQDAKVMVRHYTLLKFEAGGGGPTVAVVQMGGGGILASESFLSNEREVLEKMMGIGNESLGIEGWVEQPVGKEVGARDQNGELKINLANPLSVPINVEVRLASTKNLSTATLKENANPYVENFDSVWTLHVPYMARNLEAGAKERWRCSLHSWPQAGEVGPPQVEFVVHWNDSRKDGGRTHTVVLKRRVPVVPTAEVVLEKKVELNGDAGWENAYRGGVYGWEASVKERKERSATWEMAEDGERIFVRVRVDADEASGFAGVSEEAPPVVLTDAVAVAWASGADALPASVQRVVVMPYAPEGQRLWTNNGVGAKQTGLVRLDAKKFGVEAEVELRKGGGFEVTLGLPRKLVGEGCVMNVTALDNDGGLETTERSWAKEEIGPKGWGRVVVKAKVAETQAATAPGKKGAETKGASTTKGGGGKGGNLLEEVLKRFLPR